MSKISFTLNAYSHVRVHDLNNKSYKLKRGVNHLELEYKDYESLMKALGCTPLPDPDLVKESKPEEPIVEEQVKPEESAVEEPIEQKPEEPAIEEHDKSEDKYSEMSYSQLKAEYKRITGKSCKLKKEEVIEFLREHENV
jgi:hypothetical protein